VAKPTPTPTPAPTSATPGDPLAQIRALGDQIKASAGAPMATQTFLGLPAQTTDLSTTLAPNVAPGAVAPRYYQGAEWLPVMKNATPQERRMINAGLLDKDYRQGVWDAPSQAAFGQVLELANASGTEWQQALGTYENSTPMQWNAQTGTFVKGTPGTTRTRAPIVTRYTSPDDLAVTAQEVATSKLGRTFTPAELQKFIAAYHGTEQSASTAQGAASGAGGGGYTDAPSMQTAADTFAQQQDPTAYTAEKFLPLVQHLNNLLAGPNLATTKPMPA
jgi:hypothetical protein